jgi:small subunit ribosomal protein S16
MAVKIRLSRIGKKGLPIYRIVAVDSRKKRDGAFLEDLGTYDSVAKNIVCIRQDRIDAWVGNGAILVDSVKKICKLNKGAKPASEETPKVAKKAKATASKSVVA